MNLGNHTPRLSLLTHTDFPATKSNSSRKTITPFTKARKNDLHTPKGKKSNKSSKSESNQKTVTNEEFRSMLEIKEKVSPTVPSLLGRSLFDLSLCLRPLTDVLDQIKIFKYNAPLHLYKYTSLIKLISAAVKCPPDATLLLLTIGGRMIKAENYAKPEYLHELIKITQNMISKKYTYESYKDQKKPQKKLLKLLELFRGALTMPQKKPEGTYGTSEIERIMEKEQLEKKMKSSKLGNDSSSPKPKRKKLKTPTKQLDNFEENKHDKDNENVNENDNEFVNDENTYDYATTPVRRSTNPKLLPVRTPKTGTPRKLMPGNSKQRKGTKATPRTAKTNKSNLPAKSIDTPKTTKPNKNKKEDSNDEVEKSKDFIQSPDSENQSQQISKDEEIKKEEPQEKEVPQRPYLNIYSDSDPEHDDKAEKTNNNNNNKTEENKQLKSNDPLGQSKYEFETNNMEINAIDFANVRKRKVRKSTSTIDVGAILAPNSPKPKKKNKHSMGDPKHRNLPIELDFHSSTLNSSSFLNIIGNAVSDFDDNASQATNQSGINSISRELRGFLFDGPDSESSEIQSHEESNKNNQKNKNAHNNVNNDLYLRAKRLATINTFDAADYVEPESNENVNAHKNNKKNTKAIYSSETSSIFKEDDDDANFFERLRSPSETLFASVITNKSPEKEDNQNTKENKDVNPESLKIGDQKGNLNEKEEEEEQKENKIEEEEEQKENANNEEEEEEENDENDKPTNHKFALDIDSLSEIPDSVDEEEFINNNKNETKTKQAKVPTLVLESLQNNLDSVSENNNSPLNSIHSNRLSTTGTSPYSGNLSSDYSPGMSTSPRRFDSTGIIDIIERKPNVILQNSNEIHIDIQPDPNASIISNSTVTISSDDYRNNNNNQNNENKDANEIQDKNNNINTVTFDSSLNFDDRTDKSYDDSKLIEDIKKPIKLEWSERYPNDEDDDNISLSLTKKSKQFWSIEKFLNSKGNIYQRRSRGAKLYEDLDQRQVNQISELAKLFTAWNTAYSSSKVVWDVMKNDDKFDIDVLLSQIPISYGDFLIEGLTTFAQNEGIHIKEISHPL